MGDFLIPASRPAQHRHCLVHLLGLLQELGVLHLLLLHGHACGFLSVCLSKKLIFLEFNSMLLNYIWCDQSSPQLGRLHDLSCDPPINLINSSTHFKHNTKFKTHGVLGFWGIGDLNPGPSRALKAAWAPKTDSCSALKAARRDLLQRDMWDDWSGNFHLMRRALGSIECRRCPQLASRVSITQTLQEKADRKLVEFATHRPGEFSFHLLL